MSDPLAELAKMTYPGRLIAIGLDPAGDRVVVCYAITGRSPSSQARRLQLEGNAVWTQPVDMEAVKKGQVDLLLYKAIAIGRGVAVSNGRQTDDILRAFENRNDPQEILTAALKSWTFEPDAPHYTPRISGCVLPGGKACLSIIRRAGDGSPLVQFSSWILVAGRAKLLATYNGKEENPLPPFAGNPRDIEVIEPAASAMAAAVFEALSPAAPERDYRVAVASVYVPRADWQKFEVHIINKK